MARAREALALGVEADLAPEVRALGGHREHVALALLLEPPRAELASRIARPRVAPLADHGQRDRPVVAEHGGLADGDEPTATGPPAQERVEQRAQSRDERDSGVHQLAARGFCGVLVEAGLLDRSTDQDRPVLPGHEVAGLAPDDVAERDVRGLKVQELPAHWLPYVHVLDLDASLQKAKKLGIAHEGDTQEVAGVGRFATLRAPDGTRFAIMTPAPRA